VNKSLVVATFVICICLSFTGDNWSLHKILSCSSTSRPRDYMDQQFTCR